MGPNAQRPLPATAGAGYSTGPTTHADWPAALATWCFTGLLTALGFSFGFHYLDRASFGVPAQSDILDAFAIFDGRWYRQIAVSGYSYDPDERSSVAFFPVYPLLARGVMRLTGLRPEIALLIVSNLSFLVALGLLTMYVRARFRDAPAELAECAVLAAALFPMGCFFRLAYSESTFLALTLLSMLAMARRWPLWRISLLVGLATAARPVGVALLAPLTIHIWRTSASLTGGVCSVTSANRAPARTTLVRLAAYLPLACWGLFAFMSYQRWSFGDALAFAKVQRNWGVMPNLPWAEKLPVLATLGPIRAVYDVASPAYWGASDPGGAPWFSLQLANPAYLLGAVVLMAIGVGRRWLSSEEAALSALLLLIPYVTRAYEMGCGSMGRFTTVAFPMYLVLAQLLALLPASARCLLIVVPGFLMAAYAALFAAGRLIF